MKTEATFDARRHRESLVFESSVLKGRGFSRSVNAPKSWALAPAAMFLC
jgi:hypothetical protein